MSNSTDVPLDLSRFENLRTETYLDVVSAALLVYDFLLTFHAEVRLIWPSRWNLIKVLFFLTRYLPFIDISLVLFYQTKTNITVETCKKAYYPAGWLIVIGITLAEIILMIRTWAIWGRSRRIAICLGVACVSLLVPVLVIEHLWLKTLVFSPYPSPATPGCLLTGGSSIIAVSFIIVIIFETFVLVLTLIKGVQHYRLAGNRDLVAVLYRDGVLFYIYLFIISIINFIVIVAAPRELADILAIFQRVMHSCLSARVLLNLREARERETRLTSLNSTPLQHISFDTTQNSDQSRRERQRRWDEVVLDISPDRGTFVVGDEGWRMGEARSREEIQRRWDEVVLDISPDRGTFACGGDGLVPIIDRAAGLEKQDV
ncbi:hypothetical protein BXZ70DRAFT_47824 [Cristinia sonorae]|uniref:DUF6533 domain-containing protein n=1 Tax=Cristinia sonorae TaxID=1940300 RepID=A0A8K0XRA3_9AGAR|nr:hypothetical protein BXZ70DRAFT_47824 [Cristinia sonorae]